MMKMASWRDTEETGTGVKGVWEKGYRAVPSCKRMESNITVFLLIK